MNRKKLLGILSSGVALIAIVFVFSLKVRAADPPTDMPMPYWGTPSATWESGGQSYTTYYQGVSDKTGQVTTEMWNPAPATLPDLLFGSSPKCITDTLDSDLSNAKCIDFNFASYTGAVGTKILDSNTFINHYLKAVTAVIEYPSINVTGDSYNTSGDFAYWGQHLRQTTCNLATDPECNSNAFEQIGGYQFNPLAQSYFNSGTNAAMTDAIERLKLNSKPTGSPNNILSAANSWTNPGQFDGICGFGGTSCSDSNQYPDGRVWYTAPKTAPGLSITTTSVSYSRKSTFIIDEGSAGTREDVKISKSITNAPGTSGTSSIGFIVTDGDVYIQNTAKTELTIDASFFVPNGTIHVSGSNINLVGSFVAKSFDVDTTSSSNINFIQDTRDESVWPPGFRDLIPFSSTSS
jgi:hypothetical protein